MSLPRVRIWPTPSSSNPVARHQIKRTMILINFPMKIQTTSRTPTQAKSLIMSSIKTMIKSRRNFLRTLKERIKRRARFMRAKTKKSRRLLTTLQLKPLPCWIRSQITRGMTASLPPSSTKSWIERMRNSLMKHKSPIKTSNRFQRSLWSTHLMTILNTRSKT